VTQRGCLAHWRHTKLLCIAPPPPCHIQLYPALPCCAGTIWNPVGLHPAQGEGDAAGEHAGEGAPPSSELKVQGLGLIPNPVFNHWGEGGTAPMCGLSAGAHWCLHVISYVKAPVLGSAPVLMYSLRPGCLWVCPRCAPQPRCLKAPWCPPSVCPWCAHLCFPGPGAGEEAAVMAKRAVCGQPEPRDPHPHERHHRLLAAPGGLGGLTDDQQELVQMISGYEQQYCTVQHSTVQYHVVQYSTVLRDMVPFHAGQ